MKGMGKEKGKRKDGKAKGCDVFRYECIEKHRCHAQYSNFNRVVAGEYCVGGKKNVGSYLGGIVYRLVDTYIVPLFESILRRIF